MSMVCMIQVVGFLGVSDYVFVCNFEKVLG